MAWAPDRCTCYGSVSNAVGGPGFGALTNTASLPPLSVMFPTLP